ncbi:type 2 lanthipeptide synthetase LanM family protein [Streptosporangium sp. NBC_01495]|uniref:type 2 lanthipeptide synthetase LanM family protein n=1 Tax=Streptosporangium sp. NBC_01495 TaxID=2903899 RepID=UPI002E300F8E|nr:type 2 lanthipeptide synthetase LanM family protein [Streptosporangium sp. NBC_01495]
MNPASPPAVVPPRVRAAARPSDRATAPEAARPVAGAGASEAVVDTSGVPAGRDATLSDAVRPLVRQAVGRLVAGAARLEGGPGLASVRERFAIDLTARLTRIASRVLVFELNARRVRGELSGATPAERFADFVGRVGGEKGLAGLLEDYPVLARLLRQAADQAVEAGLELLTRFAADREHLRELLGGDPGSPVEFSAAGDSHLGGRAVTVVTLAGGAKVVYRPRPVQAYLHFAEVLDWLNERLPGLGLRVPRAVRREGYGWTEFVLAEPCADAAEVERFYTRAGALLALLYALNAIDVHYENLIACADQPVLVDVETLFHAALPAEASADPALHALRDSVQRTALLPKMMVGEQGALDVSGLGGDKDGVYPFLSAQWEEAGTDTMRLVRGVTRFTGAANRPTLNGVDADPADHVPSLLAGFRRAYDAIAAGHDELLRGPLARFGQAEVRVLLRPTRFYGELLIESTHPDVMRSTADRDEVFDLLDAVSAGDPARSAAVPSERADLWAGDIPYFGASPGEREIRDGGGRALPWRPEESGLDLVAAKLARLGDADRENQEWIIQASMAARVAGGRHAPGEPSEAPLPATVPHPAALVAAARGIADRLCATAHRDGRTVNWLGLEPVEDGRWTIMPLGAGLSSGYLGVALFLAQASRATGISRYMDFARMAVRPLPRLLERIGAHEALLRAVGCGGFSGLGGIAYGLSQLGVLLGDAEVASWVEPAVEAAGAAVTDEAPLDVHDGLAGCLAAMLAVRHSTGAAVAGRVAAACAERLAASVPSAADLPPGFAFGAAGVGWALVRQGPSPDGARLLTRAAARAAEGDTWCHGRAGVRLALSDALSGAALPGDPTASPTVSPTVSPISGVPLGGHGLCHGEAGRLETLSALARRGDDPDARRSLHRHTGRLLASLDTYGARCGTPRHASTPGLLDGLAGIGHGLLRLALPEMTPSVLLLRPTDEGETRGL